MFRQLLFVCFVFCSGFTLAALAASAVESSGTAVKAPTKGAVGSPAKESAIDLLKPTQHDVVLGDPAAKVTVIEYHSVTCPHCAYFNANTMPKIIEKFINTGQVLYVIREYPVDAQSFDASLIMRCMPKNKVLAFESVLFATQKDWWGRKQYMDTFKTYASLGGVDIENLNACTQNSKVRDAVFQDKLDAVKLLNVLNIPTFFVNGQKYEGARPWEYWESLLSEAVNDAQAIEDANKVSLKADAAKTAAPSAA